MRTPLDGRALLLVAVGAVCILAAYVRIAQAASTGRRLAARRARAALHPTPQGTRQVLERGCIAPLRLTAEQEAAIDDALALRFDRALPIEAADDGA